MNELNRLIKLHEQLRLVGRGNDELARERFCSDFTEEAARMLFAEGWRRIRKTEGKNVDGMDIDKLVHATTFRVVDIIVDAGLDRARVAFNDAGVLQDSSRFIAVQPIEVLEPQPPTPEPEPGPDTDELMDVMQDLVNGCDQTNAQLERIATAFNQLNKTLELLVLELGARPS